MTDPTPTLRTTSESITHGYIAVVLRAALISLAALVLAAPAGAMARDAAGGPTVDASPLLWATINICDTVKHPDTIGIRASMPGSGNAKERMYMRFQVQYWQAQKQAWAPTDATVDSDFQPVGSAKYRRRESGWNFSITPPPQGQTYRLRGIVSYQWRVGKKVVRKATKRTRSGHKGTDGADPKNASAAECIITP
jgi:hypothetical protein